MNRQQKRATRHATRLKPQHTPSPARNSRRRNAAAAAAALLLVTQVGDAFSFVG